MRLNVDSRPPSCALCLAKSLFTKKARPNATTEADSVERSCAVFYRGH